MIYRFQKVYRKPEHPGVFHPKLTSHLHTSLLWFKAFQFPLSLIWKCSLHLHLQWSNQSYNFLIWCKWRISQLHGNTTASVRGNDSFHQHDLKTQLEPRPIFHTPACPFPPPTSPPCSKSLMPLHYLTHWTFQHHKNPPFIAPKVPSDRKYVFHILKQIKHWVTRPADFAGSVCGERNGNI